MFLVFNALGTPTQTAVQKYHNAKKVPQLFLATGASKWNDPKDFPWTMGYQPSYRVEALPRNATGKIHKPTLRQTFSTASATDMARAVAS